MIKKKLSFMAFLTMLLTFIFIVNCCVSHHETHHFCQVSGKIIGKNIEQHSSSKDHIDTYYMMAIQPHNTTLYKSFDVSVSYATYCTYNVGNNITFNSIHKDKCLRIEEDTDWKYVFLFIGSIISSVLTMLSLFNWMETLHDY